MTGGAPTPTPWEAAQAKEPIRLRLADPAFTVFEDQQKDVDEGQFDSRAVVLSRGLYKQGPWPQEKP
jgi:hypothetical protein